MSINIVLQNHEFVPRVCDDGYCVSVQEPGSPCDGAQNCKDITSELATGPASRPDSVKTR